MGVDASSTLFADTRTIHLLAGVVGVLVTGVSYSIRSRLTESTRTLLSGCLIVGALFFSMWVIRQLFLDTEWAAELTDPSAVLLPFTLGLFWLLLSGMALSVLWLYGRGLSVSPLVGLFAVTYNLFWAMFTVSYESNSLIIHFGVVFPIVLVVTLVLAGIEFGILRVVG